MFSFSNSTLKAKERPSVITNLHPKFDGTPLKPDTKVILVFFNDEKLTEPLSIRQYSDQEIEEFKKDRKKGKCLVVDPDTIIEADETFPAFPVVYASVVDNDVPRVTLRVARTGENIFNSREFVIDTGSAFTLIPTSPEYFATLTVSGPHVNGIGGAIPTKRSAMLVRREFGLMELPVFVTQENHPLLLGMDTLKAFSVILKDEVISLEKDGRPENFAQFLRGLGDLPNF